MAAAAGLSSVSATMIKVFCQSKGGDEITLAITTDETLSGLIERVREASKTEYPVKLFWDGRDQPGARLKSTSTPYNQYSIEWENHKPEGPEIALSWGTPQKIRAITKLGGSDFRTAEKGVRVSKEVFDSIQLIKVCDLKHSSCIGFEYLEAYGKLPPAPAASPAPSVAVGPAVKSRLISAAESKEAVKAPA